MSICSGCGPPPPSRDICWCICWTGIEFVVSFVVERDPSVLSSPPPGTTLGLHIHYSLYPRSRTAGGGWGGDKVEHNYVHVKSY